MKSIKIIVTLAVALLSLFGNTLTGQAGTTQTAGLMAIVDVVPLSDAPAGDALSELDQPTTFNEGPDPEVLPQPTAPIESLEPEALPQPEAPSESPEPEVLPQPAAPNVGGNDMLLKLLFLPTVSS